MINSIRAHVPIDDTHLGANMLTLCWFSIPAPTPSNGQFPPSAFVRRAACNDCTTGDASQPGACFAELRRPMALELQLFTAPFHFLVVVRMCYQTKFIDLLDSSQRRPNSAQWNALWEASDSQSPMSRFEQLLLWHDFFGKGRALKAVVVERDGVWVAAIPLIRARRQTCIPVWEEELGGVELVVHRPTDRAAVESLVREGFAIEDRGWKGRQGTSVVQSPGMLAYFIGQAQICADHGELVLLFLRHQRQAIAFEYGWLHRRTYYSPKIAYDEQFAHLSPGQLLLYLWLEQQFARNEIDAVDFYGPLAEATSKWITRSESRRRWLVGLNKLGASILVGRRFAQSNRQKFKRIMQRLRTSKPATQSATPRPSAESPGKKVSGLVALAGKPPAAPN